MTLDSELQVFLPADARPTLRRAGILPGKHSFERFSSETNFETLKGASESHLWSTDQRGNFKDGEKRETRVSLSHYFDHHWHHKCWAWQGVICLTNRTLKVVGRSSKSKPWQDGDHPGQGAQRGQHGPGDHDMVKQGKCSHLNFMHDRIKRNMKYRQLPELS